MEVIKEFYYRFKSEYSRANEVLSPERREHYRGEFEIYLDILKNYAPLQHNEGFFDRQLRHLYIRKLTRCLSAVNEISPRGPNWTEPNEPNVHKN